MSIFEYNQEEEERKWKESVYEAARAEGKIEAEKEIVQSLAERGMDLRDIAEITKISQETIQEWLNKK